MASNLLAMASNLLATASSLLAMAFSLLAMASIQKKQGKAKRQRCPPIDNQPVRTCRSASSSISYYHIIDVYMFLISRRENVICFFHIKVLNTAAQRLVSSMPLPFVVAVLSTRCLFSSLQSAPARASEIQWPWAVLFRWQLHWGSYINQRGAAFVSRASHT